MIQSFADQATADIFAGLNTKAARRFHRNLWIRTRRKLEVLNAATGLADLKVIPGLGLHALDEDQAGRYAIEVNKQYRITFAFTDAHAYEVRVEDYHD